MALTGPNKYVITQLLANGDLLQLHPRTDADIVRILDTAGMYNGANIESVLANEVLNISNTAQTKSGALTITGLLSADGNLDIGANLSIKSDTSNIVFTNSTFTSTLNTETLTGNVTLLLPDMTEHPLYGTGAGLKKVFTLATTDDLPPIDPISSLFNFTFGNTPGEEDFGELVLSPFESKQTDTIAFDTGSVAPSYTGRLNLNANLYTTNLNVTTGISTSTLSASSTIEATGLASLNGGIEVDGESTALFSVDTEGNTYIDGTLDVIGDTTVTGLSNLDGGIAVATDKFTVAATGATIIDSTLDVTGIATFNEDLLVGPIVGSPGTFEEKFSVDVTTGDVSTEGNIEVQGDLTIHGEDILFDSSTFNINHADPQTVNTTVLNIDSAAIVSGSDRTINIGTNGLSGSDTTINIGSQAEAVDHSIINLFGTVNVIGGTGSVITTDELNVANNQIVLNSNLTGTDDPFAGESGIIINRGEEPEAKFEWDEVLGKWTATGGLVGEGNSYIEGTFFSTGDFWVGGTTLSASKFNVKADTGNTVIEGTLTTKALANLDAGIAVDGSKFTVADGTGDTYIDGTLEVKSAAEFNGGISGDEGTWSIADITGNIYTEGTLTVDGQTTLTNTLLITDKATPTPTTLFSVSGTNGNTLVGGTLSVTDNATFNKNLTIAGSSTPATEYFTITNGAGTPTTTFQVDSATGNTTIVGTLGVTGTTTVGDINIGGSITVDGDTFTVNEDGDVYIGGDLTLEGIINGLDITGGASSFLDVAAGKTVDVNGNLTVNGNGVTLATGANAVTVTFNDNLTVGTLTSGYNLYASDTNTISTEEYVALVRGGTGVDNTEVAVNRVFAGPGTGTEVGNATFRSLVNADLPNSGVTAGTYSSVQVNSKGVVTAGGQFIEVGETGQTLPDENFGLVEGGLFFMEITA
jgi:hypothetical protein